jgi:glycosyltransferase involved in cell wall biosynthesis|nr:glycosyltransferase [uncultured Acetatifactor sp.]
MRRVIEIFGEPISWGGQESYVMSALQNMDLTDICVDFFTPYYCNNEASKIFVEAHGGRVYAGELPFKTGGSRREIIPVLHSILCNTAYDVAHIHSGSTSVLAYSAREASMNGVKRIIVHSHSSGLRENIRHFLIKTYSAHIFRSFVTDYCACSLEAAKWKFPKDRMEEVKILRNGIDIEKFSYNKITRREIRDKYCIDEETLVLGHVGRFTYEKNQAFLLGILQIYTKRFIDKKVKLILVGDGNELENVRTKATVLGIEDDVLFVGTSSTVSDYMQCFDIFLFPSLYEGLGIVSVEAQASGLPVIASKGIPESMKVTDNVRFVDLHDVAGWCDAIVDFESIERKDTSIEIKDKGYDIHDTAHKVYEMYM